MAETSLVVETTSATLGKPDPSLAEAPPTRDPTPAEGYVIRRLQRGNAVVLRHEARWRELWAHYDGEQFTEVQASDNSLQRVETREGGSKPRWRSRLVRNRFTKGIAGEVSVVGSRVPAWACDPMSADPDSINAARLGEKVLLNLQEQLKLRGCVYRCLTIAAVTGDGFAWPVWNPMLGTELVDPLTGEPLLGGKRTGEIEIHELRQDQVMWQPGAKFEASRWHAVRIAKPVEDLVATPGYLGPPSLQGDAQVSSLDTRDMDGTRDLIFLYHYLERPSQKHPKGRWMQVAGGHEVFKEADFPSERDAPVIHRLPWIQRPHRDRSLGLGELAIDTQRSINRILNQLVTWRNLVLNPQVFAPENSLKTKLSDEPGKVFEYRPTGGGKPEWRETPEIPVSLFRELEQAYADIDYLCGGGPSLPAGVESGQGIQEFNEREMSFRSMIISGLADWYSSLGMHLLHLVRMHYTEERLLKVQGRFGVELIPDFKGSLMGEISNVRVSEASITPRTRAQQEAKIMAFADKGWIDPHQAMSALSGGTAESILDAFELHIAKAYRNIQRLIDWGKMTGDGPLDAGPMDNHAIHIDIYKQWMTTSDYEAQPEAVQLMAVGILEQHQLEERTDAAMAAEQTTIAAEGQGMSNAGKPQGGKPMPSRPSIANEAAALSGGG